MRGLRLGLETVKQPSSLVVCADAHIEESGSLWNLSISVSRYQNDGGTTFSLL